jgi:hypothetical protein
MIDYDNYEKLYTLLGNYGAKLFCRCQLPASAHDFARAVLLACCHCSHPEVLLDTSIVYHSELYIAQK